ncbi:MAG: hypothetical protein FJW96_02470 [Actinobacteria bacterium]|nr:hypothetical protein [Actinomycetota bacterium]
MRLVTFVAGGRRAVGAVDGARVVDLQLAYALHLADTTGDPYALEAASVRIPQSMTAFIGGLEPSWRSAETALA